MEQFGDYDKGLFIGLAIGIILVFVFQVIFGYIGGIAEVFTVPSIVLIGVLIALVVTIYD